MTFPDRRARSSGIHVGCPGNLAAPGAFDEQNVNNHVVSALTAGGGEAVSSMSNASTATLMTATSESTGVGAVKRCIFGPRAVGRPRDYAVGRRGTFWMVLSGPARDLERSTPIRGVVSCPVEDRGCVSDCWTAAICRSAKPGTGTAAEICTSRLVRRPTIRTALCGQLAERDGPDRAPRQDRSPVRRGAGRFGSHTECADHSAPRNRSRWHCIRETPQECLLPETAERIGAGITEWWSRHRPGLTCTFTDAVSNQSVPVGPLEWRSHVAALLVACVVALTAACAWVRRHRWTSSSRSNWPAE